MAISSSSMKFSFILFLLTLLSSHQINARDSQFFNKIPPKNNNAAAAAAAAYEIQTKQDEDPLDKLDQEPNFTPQNAAAYGLYGQESDKLTPSTTNTNLPYKNKNQNEPNEFLPKYLPKNYNTVAYVTEPEGYHQESNNYYYPNNYQSQNKHPAAANNNNNYPYQGQEANYYQNYDEGSSGGNSQQQGVNQNLNQYNLGQESYTTSGAGEDTSSSTNYNYNYNYNNNNNVAGAAANKQGMSDTRFLENGKYFYDVNLEKNTNRYPLDNTRRYGDQYRKYASGHGNNNNDINSNDFNYSNDGGYYGNNVNQAEDDEGFP